MLLKLLENGLATVGNEDIPDQQALGSWRQFEVLPLSLHVGNKNSVNVLEGGCFIWSMIFRMCDIPARRDVYSWMTTVGFSGMNDLGWQSMACGGDPKQDSHFPLVVQTNHMHLLASFLSHGPLIDRYHFRTHLVTIRDHRSTDIKRRDGRFYKLEKGCIYLRKVIWYLPGSPCTLPLDIAETI